MTKIIIQIKHSYTFKCKAHNKAESTKNVNYQRIVKS
jgi:hypothetical protein